jgi:hypothetical protein
LRYVVVDTGTWPSGGRVLLANWINSVQPERKTIVVCIEKKRIQEPPICDSAYDPTAFHVDREPELQRPAFPYVWPG